jgi:flagellar biosynthesis/type III secretory pathway chaperone
MSDIEALKIFSKQPVSSEMVNFLVETTNSIIQIKTIDCQPAVSLKTFILNLIKYSNVQTPTLMATLYYLNKLRNLLPANAVGIETTRHRIFLSSLILSAKSLNDSSPLNKHWQKYTNNLLSLRDINLAEKELIGLLNWNLNINQSDLITSLQPFLSKIKLQLSQKLDIDSNKKFNFYRLSNTFNVKNRQLTSPTNSNNSISNHYKSDSTSSQPTSSSSISSYSSTLSLSNDVSSDENEDIAYFTMHHPSRKPLSNVSLNIPLKSRIEQKLNQNICQNSITC